jgi:hypothetical protein
MGTLLVIGAAPKVEGETGTVTLTGIGSFETRAILGSALGLQCQFVKVSQDQRKVIAAAIEAAQAQDAPFIARAQSVAADIAALLERALRDNAITLADLFDTEYTPIEGTDPLQLLARHTALTDQILPAVLEPALAADPKGVFCAATDRNGYVATHNRGSSEPQRPGDPAWNAINCRNRRIFDDRSGILAARNPKPVLTQTYARDLGGGNFLLLKEIDSPIVVNGRHWGAVRYGLRLA